MKILCVSLGCDKNLVDTEMMLGLLNRDGHTFTDDENEADIIVINTCCFINDAKEESVNTILEMAELKKTGKCKALIVTGCMAQRYKQEILEEIPEVDGILGTSTYDFQCVKAGSWRRSTCQLLPRSKCASGGGDLAYHYHRRSLRVFKDRGRL